jgi:hypothetical protein
MKTVLLISSCDAFHDCWGPMLYSLEKFWPNCPFPVCVINNYEKINSSQVSVINVGKDQLFASNLKLALSKLDCEYIIYFQDDYFLSEYVNTEAIHRHIGHCIEENVDFLKIHTNDFLLRDHLRVGDSNYCKNPVDVRYSLNTSVAVWRKSLLEKLCVDGYSGWDWERKIIPFIHMNRININSEILHSSIMDSEGITTVSGGAVAKGRWTRNGMKFLLNNGFDDLLHKRSVEGRFITKLATFYNRHPRSIFRYPIVMIMRTFLKFKINI